MKKTLCSILMLLTFAVTLHKACELIINTNKAFFSNTIYLILPTSAAQCFGFVCDNGECTRSIVDRCRGFVECSDGSDERDCDSKQSSD